MTIAAILAALGGLAASAGPLALAGGPVGIVIAWLGNAFGGKSVKLIALGVGLLFLVGATVGITVRIQHLERDSAAYKALAADMASLQTEYGCDSRPAHERDLGTCLTAIARDSAKAQAAEIMRQRNEAAMEQARRDVADEQARRDQRAADDAIDQSSPVRDGPVPGVLLDHWARERAARGLKR